MAQRRRPGAQLRAFFVARGILLAAATRPAATTTGATAWPTPTTPAIVVGAADLRTGSARRLNHRRRRAIHAVEVGLGLLVELLALFLVKIVAAFDENGALI